LFAAIRKEDIENEIRAITKLCKSEHPNIVQVLQYGQLQEGVAMYFIDMELCTVSLEQYIQAENVQELDQWKEYQKIAKDPTDDSRKTVRSLVQDKSQVPFTATYIILQHIVNGLLYIHCLREVHRDLSPQNSMSIYFKLTSDSPFQRRLLENRRLWAHG
jgi:serine/threonine protein kinase